MAGDAYLKLDGVPGESTDGAHKDWIELLRCNWGIIQPKSATASTGGGHTAGRCEHRPLTIVKLADMATPKLLELASCGRTIQKAKFEFQRADGDGKPIKFFEIELENVLVAAISPAFEPGEGIIETVSFVYSQVKWTYSKQKIEGGTAGKTMGGWNLAKNSIAA